VVDYANWLTAAAGAIALLAIGALFKAIADDVWKGIKHHRLAFIALLPSIVAFGLQRYTLHQLNAFAGDSAASIDQLKAILGVASVSASLQMITVAILGYLGAVLLVRISDHATPPKQP